MDIFIKAVTIALIAIVLYLVISRQDKDIAFMLSVMACCMVGLSALRYLEPVIQFLTQLKSVAGLDTQLYQILLKSAGIGLLAEIAALFCADAGQAALGKTVQLMAAAVILWLSLPLFSALLDIVSKILGEL